MNLANKGGDAIAGAGKAVVNAGKDAIAAVNTAVNGTWFKFPPWAFS